MTSVGSMGPSGSKIADSGTRLSASRSLRAFTQARPRPDVWSESTAASREPSAAITSSTRSGARPRCSPSSRFRKRAMAVSMRACPPDSIARSHSVSRPRERLVKFAEPTRANVSSIMQIFEWMKTGQGVTPCRTG